MKQDVLISNNDDYKVYIDTVNDKGKIVSTITDEVICYFDLSSSRADLSFKDILKQQYNQIYNQNKESNWVELGMSFDLCNKAEGNWYTLTFSDIGVNV